MEKMTTKKQQVLNIMSSGEMTCHNCIDNEMGENKSRQLARILCYLRNKVVFVWAENGSTYVFHIHCEECNKTTQHSQIIGRAEVKPQDLLSDKFKKRILKTLSINAISGKENNETEIDHKDPRAYINPQEDCSDEEIKQHFQLLTTSQNDTKREVCKKCVATGIRQWCFLPWFSEGTEKYEGTCKGCPHFDYRDWFQKLASQKIM
jgi:hypothetical protein